MNYWFPAIVAILFLLAIVKPHWGIMLFVALLPIEAVLPRYLIQGIPFFTSPISMVGSIVVAGAVLGMALTNKIDLRSVFTDKVRLAGLFFIAWFFAAHPMDAWFSSDRNYVYTFVQLWVLLVLAGTLLESKERQITLMVIFAAACILSAYVAITQGEIGVTREETMRSSGLMSGLNTSARYFVIGLVFLVYLRTKATYWGARWLASGGVIFLLVGVMYAGSRAGIMLAVLSLVLLLFFGTRTRKAKYLVYLIATLVAVTLFLPEGADSIASSFYTQEMRPRESFQSIDENIRYYLWQAGFQMWLDNPIDGVGMGQYTRLLHSYLPGVLPGRYEVLSSHNMFVKVLAETGIVGFGLFVAMIWMSIRRLWRAHTNVRDSSLQISEAWLIALIVIVVGGLLKDDHADKMLWLFLGVSSSFGAGVKSVSSTNEVDQIGTTPSG